MASDRTILNPPASALHPPVPTYSHIASYPISDTHKLVTIAGQVGISPNGAIVEYGRLPPFLRITLTHSRGFENQMTLALHNLDTCLKHAGVSKSDIMRLGIYIVGSGPEEGRDKIRKGVLVGWLGERGAPPDTLVYVSSLAVEGLLFEVDCLAVGRV